MTLQEFVKPGKSGTSGGSAGLNGFVDALEVVPGQALYGGPKDKIGMALPALQLVLLCSTDGAADDLEDVCRSASTAVVQAYRNADDKVGAQLTGGASGHGCDQAAIRKIARADLHRLEQSGKSATGANRFGEIASLKQDGITDVEVGGNNDGRDGKVLELARIEETMNQRAEAIVAGQSEAGHPPTAKVAKTNLTTFFNDAREWESAGIGGAEDAPDAASRNASDRNVLLFEDLQNAQMRIAAGETSAKGQTDSRTEVRPVGEKGSGLRAKCHEGEILKEAGKWRWNGRSEKAVQRYRRKRLKNRGAEQAGEYENTREVPSMYHCDAPHTGPI